MVRYLGTFRCAHIHQHRPLGVFVILNKDRAAQHISSQGDEEAALSPGSPQPFCWSTSARSAWSPEQIWEQSQERKSLVEDTPPGTHSSWDKVTGQGNAAVLENNTAYKCCIHTCICVCIYMLFFFPGICSGDWCTCSSVCTDTVAAALSKRVLVLLFFFFFSLLFFHSRSWVPAHSPNLKRERKKEKELLKCSTFPESPFAREYFRCQYNLMALPAPGAVY